LSTVGTRLAITLVLLLVQLGAGYIALPGIDPEFSRYLGQSQGGGGLLSLFNIGAPAFNLLTINLVALFHAFVLVELVALAVPRLRPLRVGGPGPRRKLLVASLLVALAFATLQAYFLVRWLEGAELTYRVPVATGEGLGWVVTVMATLVAGMFLQVGIAFLISRYGLGNGFSVLIAWSSLLVLATDGVHILVRIKLGELGPIMLVGWVAAGVALAWGARRVVTPRPSLGSEAPDPLAGVVRLPTSGLVPISDGASLLQVPQLAVNLGLVALAPVSERLVPGAMAYLVTFALVSTGLCWVLSRLFYRTAAVTPLLPVEDAPRLLRARLRTQTWRTAGLLAALLVADHLLLRQRIDLDFVSVLVLTFVGMDLFAEARARRATPELVKVWELHRVYAVAPVLAALERAGIGAQLRGLHHRTLLYFFGPYVPFDVLVPAGQEARATETIEQLLAPASPRGDESPGR
jgi:hypothetical protein